MNSEKRVRVIKRRSQGGAAELSTARFPALGRVVVQRSSVCHRRIISPPPPPHSPDHSTSGQGAVADVCLKPQTVIHTHTASLFCSRGCDRRRTITLCRNLPVFSQNKAGGGEARLLAWATRTVCEYICVYMYFKYSFFFSRGLEISDNHFLF